MTIFYDELVSPTEIDTTNQFAKYAKAAILAKDIVGNNITELLTRANYTYPQPITVNSDGSISPQQNGGVDVITLTSSSGSVKLVNDDAIIIIDIDAQTGSGTSYRPPIFNLSTYGTILSITATSWGSKGLESWFELGYNNGRDSVSYTGRKIVLFHWDHVTQETNVYVDGVLDHVDAPTSINSNQVTLSFQNIKIGLGGTGNKFYGSTFLTKTGSFTQAEIDSIVADPYQLFKTSQDVQQEYSLRQPLDIDSGLLVNGLSYNTGGLIAEIELADDMASMQSVLHGIIPNSSRSLLNTSANLVFNSNTKVWTVHSGITGIFVNNVAVATLATPAAELNAALKGDVIKVTINPLSITTFTLGANKLVTGYACRGFSYKSLKLTDDNGLHYFDLNKTKGDGVTSLTSSLVANLINFPPDSGYVRNANGVIEGYQLGGIAYGDIQSPVAMMAGQKITIKFKDVVIGAEQYVIDASVNALRPYFIINADGTFTYNTSVMTATLDGSPLPSNVPTDNVVHTLTLTVTSSISVGKLGNRHINDTIFNGVLISIQLDNISSYDFTTGDSTKIIDTLGNNHATIINVSVDKWQPIVNPLIRQVSNLGTLDYINIEGCIESEVKNLVGSNERLVCNVKKGNSSKANPYIEGFIEFIGYTTSVRNNISIVSENTFSGKEGSGVNLKYNSSWGIVARNNHVLVKGFEIDNAVSYSLLHSGDNTSFENLLIKHNSGRIIIGVSGISSAKNCIFVAGFLSSNSDASVFLPTATATAKFYDCVFFVENGFGGNNGDIFIRNGELYNCVVYNNNTKVNYNEFYAVTIAENVISNKPQTELSPTIQSAGQPVNTYFTDPANNDYTINTVGQAALAGKGWNGTDIVGWAYAAAIAVAAAISGTVTASSTELDIVNGGKTLIITLTGDTWQPTGTAFDAQRQVIIDGITSAQSETNGWNNEVKAKELVTSVVRTSDTVLTITLSAAIAYNINSTETISTIIPASALVTSGSSVSTGTFTITPTAAGGFKVIWAQDSSKLIQY